MTKIRTVNDWHAILISCQVKPATAQRWAAVFAAEISSRTFSLGDSEIDDFLGQVLHESSMLERLEENLFYTTPERIVAVWPHRFGTNEQALPYLRNPVALANKVYSNRLGNTTPGDGYQYRGRGLLQVTGKDNYAVVGKALKLDLENTPDLLAQPVIALRASIAWWEGNVPDCIMGDLVRVTKRVNGGINGLAHRELLTSAAMRMIV
ncbi:glycoside hydrolase family 19 protein [Glaciimonas soli]|uniref:glycoside hydrolase family 19 protein n=1 Tax=Glaciimonas soli TaxID=2590999 RepID=UPI002AD5907B|nr:glycoside hydrolase family 19 protein [Glaciimonas soli]